MDAKSNQSHQRSLRPGNVDVVATALYLVAGCVGLWGFANEISDGSPIEIIEWLKGVSALGFLTCGVLRITARHHRTKMLEGK